MSITNLYIGVMASNHPNAKGNQMTATHQRRYTIITSKAGKEHRDTVARKDFLVAAKTGKHYGQEVLRIEKDGVPLEKPYDLA